MTIDSPPVVISREPESLSLALSHSRRLTLRLEPGSRAVALYSLSVWSAANMQAACFTGSQAEIVELLMALQVVAANVEKACPGE